MYFYQQFNDIIVLYLIICTLQHNIYNYCIPLNLPAFYVIAISVLQYSYLINNHAVFEFRTYTVCVKIKLKMNQTCFAHRNRC